MSTSNLGLKSNIGGTLAYAIGWISGLALLLLEKEDQEIRFHAAQSLILFGGLQLFTILIISIFFFLMLLMPFVQLAAIVLWVFLMVKAYQGVHYRLPVVADLADKLLDKLSEKKRLE